MLTHLTIKDLAIMESANISFSSRFNVITGETGSGKSIIIKAIGLIFGDKSNYDLISSQASSALVAGTFRVSSYSHPIFETLRQHCLLDEEDKKSIVIKRILYKKSRSQCWINDVPVTVKTLKAIASHLLDIFSQNEQLKLVNPIEQLSYLDHFILDKEISFEFKNQYEICQGYLSSLKEVLEDYEEKKQNQDYLLFRKKELDTLNPSLDDYNQLMEYCDKASFQIKNQKNFLEIQTIIDEGFSGFSLSKGVWKVKELLDKIESSELQQISKECESAANTLDEISYLINKSVDSSEVDSMELEKSQNRLAKYQSFVRKLSAENVEDLINKQEQLEKQIESLEHISDNILSTLSSLKREASKLDLLANKLTEQRLKAKATMTVQMNKELSELNMIGSSIEVMFKETNALLPNLKLSSFDESIQSIWGEVCETLISISKYGKEKIEIHLSANPGEPSKPLNKVASGGEISRIMLAFKNISSANYSDYFMIFDEVDTGISGKTADIIGQKLAKLSQNCQILCISHLPQVAAYSDHHLKISKATINNRTTSKVEHLNTKERTHEIARLLSGSEITLEGIDNASKLLQKAHTEAIQ